MSSILMHRTFGLEVLTADIHRLVAQASVPGCTLDQVKDILQQFGSQSYSRSETALCLYWQLAEDHVDKWPCQAFLEQLRQRAGEVESGDSLYHGQYALKELLEWPALRLVLRRRKRVGSARTVVFSGAAGTGKTIALQMLPPRLSEFKVLLATLPKQRAPGRKITWRPFLLSILEAQDRPSTTRGAAALLEEVVQSLERYDLLILDQAERFSLQYLGDLCTLLARCRCAVLLVGQPAFWDKVRDFDRDESFAKQREDVEQLDENDVWYCWEQGVE